MARAYLKIVHKGVPIPGDSSALSWINWVELAWISVRPAPGPDRGQLQLVEVGKRIDVSSPALGQAFLQKTLLDSMTIDIVRLDHTQKVERQARLEFSGVTVVSRSSVASNQASPASRSTFAEPFAERVTFGFTAMKTDLSPGEISHDQWR